MKISDYGFLSDCQSAALVSQNGSVDWYCVTRFDSPSVFARLLDPDAGHWRIGPAGPCEATQAYIGDSLVLKTTFATGSGTVELIDALTLQPGSQGHDIGKTVPHTLLRLVKGVSGSVEMKIDYYPRFEYGLTHANFEPGEGCLKASAGPLELILKSPVELDRIDGKAQGRFTINAGEEISFNLCCRSTYSHGYQQEAGADQSIEETIKSWESWMAPHNGYQGLYLPQVRQSALVLQGLTYQPSGAVVAAATTSLPEIMAGEANWDYRFVWLRDASLMMNALWVAACPDEPERFFAWINRTGSRFAGEAVQIMYGVEGERDLTEHTLDHLRGYGDSRPVRVGNDAWKQKQLDVLGEVLDTAYLLRDRLDGALQGSAREMLIAFADQAASSWREPDAGIWEARDQQRHYLTSKLLCWVALDRAVKLSGQLQAGDRQPAWAQARDEVRQEILAKGWSEKLQAYTGALGSDDLDASVLMMPLTGFLPATDPRMRATIEAVARCLGSEETGLVRRWAEEPNGFIICSFWLVECLAMAGEVDRATRIFEQVTGLANHVGLLTEEADLTTGEPLGNFPQAFSHVGLINAAWRLTQAKMEPADSSPTAQ